MSVHSWSQAQHRELLLARVRYLSHCVGSTADRLEAIRATLSGMAVPICPWCDKGEPATWRYGVAWHSPGSLCLTPERTAAR